ncbi:MAG TPA: hypothetical protein VGB78_01155 [Thermoplasmata archaeon]
MKVCIPCAFPGGPEAAIVDSLELSEILDYYEIDRAGSFVHTAQMRQCTGGCSDPIDSIIRRGVEAIVVTTLSPSSLVRLTNGRVRVYATTNPSVRATIDLLASGRLEEIGIDQFSKLDKK